jgi:RNA polymerase sigma factor (sigma-70 family)
MTDITELTPRIPGAPVFQQEAPVYPEQSNQPHLTNEQIKIILKGCRLNQREAQRKLYRLFFSYAMSFALRYTSNYDSAIELTNDTFLKIYRELQSFIPGYDVTVHLFTGWFKKGVIKNCISHIKKYASAETTEKNQHFLVADENEIAEQVSEHEQIIRCIQQLSPSLKAVFNLYTIDGYTHAEIAKALGISEEASNDNIHQSRLYLRQLLRKSNMKSYDRIE